jgi:hypothetical protein
MGHEASSAVEQRRTGSNALSTVPLTRPERIQRLRQGQIVSAHQAGAELLTRTARAKITKRTAKYQKKKSLVFRELQTLPILGRLAGRNTSLSVVLFGMALHLPANG